MSKPIYDISATGTSPKRLTLEDFEVSINAQVIAPLWEQFLEAFNGELPVFPDTTAGVEGTAEGQAFAVAASGIGLFDIYQVTGGAAELIGTTSSIETVTAAKEAAEAARDKANEWAENPEDTEVATGEYSARHYAAKAATAQGLAETAQGLAETAAANAQASSRTLSSWLALSALTGTVDGEGAEVPDSDTGTHFQATATSYDGDPVPNGGRYTWVEAWWRWLHIGETGLAGKVAQTDFDTAAVVWCEATISGSTITLVPKSGQDEVLKEAVVLAFHGPEDADGATAYSITYGGATKPFKTLGNLTVLPRGAMFAGHPVYAYCYPLGPGAWYNLTDATALKNLQYVATGVTAVSYSSGNYDLTANWTGAQNEIMFWFVAGTGGAADDIAASISFNGGAAYPLLHGDNEVVLASDLDQYQPTLAVWKKGPVNKFHVVGPLSKRVSTLESSSDDHEARLEGLEAIGPVKAATMPEALWNAVIEPINGDIVYNAGVPTITDTTVNVVCLGNSVNASVLDPDERPGKYFVNQLAAKYPAANIAWTYDNQAQDGQAIADFPTQLGAATVVPDILLMFPGQNDTGPASYNCGETLPGARTALKNTILLARELNPAVIVILATSPCNDPARANDFSIPAGNTPSYPYRFYAVTGSYVFDAAAKTISSPTFADPLYGGDALSIGETVTVTTTGAPAANAGSHVITDISVDRETLTVGASTISSETLVCRVSHTGMDEETHLVPPPSASIAFADWANVGVPFSKLVRHNRLTDMIREVAASDGCLLLDVDNETDDYVADNGGDPARVAMYDGDTSGKHQALLGVQVTYQAAIRKLVREFASSFQG